MKADRCDAASVSPPLSARKDVSFMARGAAKVCVARSMCELHSLPEDYECVVTPNLDLSLLSIPLFFPPLYLFALLRIPQTNPGGYTGSGYAS